MKRILALAQMELFFSVRRSSFLVYYAVLFLLSAFFVNLLGGLIPGVNVVTDSLVINAPQFADAILSRIVLITTFIIAIFAGGGAMRDYTYGSHEITFTYPLSRYQYVLGKLGGIYLANLVLFTAPLLGYAIACKSPWLNKDLFVPFNLVTYSNIFLQKILVDVFVLSTAFYMLGLLLRNIVVNWVAIILFYVLYYMAGRYYGQSGTRVFGALLDPYGITATASVNVGKSTDQKITQQLPLTGLYLWNRVLWTGIGFVFLAFTLWRFRFSYQVSTLRFKKRTYAPLKNLFPDNGGLTVPKAPRAFGAIFRWQTLVNQVKLECRQLFRNVYFWLIGIIGVGFLVGISFFVGQLLETPGYPTTIRVLESYMGVLGIFLLLMIMVFSGEVVWKDKQYRLQGITNSTPSSPAVRLAAKTIAVYIPILLMLGIVLVGGILLQVLKDYNQFNIGLYLQYLLGYTAVQYLFYAILAVGLQTFVNGKYQGYALFAAVYIILEAFGDKLLQQGFLIPGHFPDVSYSDISGFQGAFYPFYIFAIYWLAFALLLWRAGVHLWKKSGEESWKVRWRSLLQTGLRGHSAVTWALAACFVGLGIFIWYNTNILNEHHSPEYYNKLKAGYERSFARYRNEPQLSLDAVKGDVALYPGNRSMKAHLALTLINKTSVPVRRIYLNYGKHEYFRDVRSSVGWKQVLKDDRMDFYGYEFDRPVQPGDSVIYTYEFNYAPKGFTDNGVASMVNENGTFINNTVFLPVIGYDPGNELDGNKLRRQYDLGPKPYAPAQNDPVALQQNMLGQGADRIRLALTLSTVQGQTAIAPGYLTRQWQKDGRAYFDYEMDVPAVNYYSIQSGRYDVKSASCTIHTDSQDRQVALSVYYHPGHPYNVDLMMSSMKDALAYYSSQFGPYQYRQLRIIEFPSSSFAQSFANTIPFSENIGFLADLRDTATSSLDKKPADYVYYVTAHEVAHQWWAHQILPANTEGANFLCEALAQYSALMLMKHKYGDERTRRFLQMESFNYLGARSGETKEERPLARVLMEQQYIFYEKGACVLYALQNYLGEQTINNVLKAFVHDYAYKERPYVTSDVLVGRLKAAAPDSLKYLVDDCLEKIILYDNRINSASYTMNDETLEYTISADITGRKLSYTNKGREQEVPMNDWIMIGIYSKDDKLVATEKLKVRSGSNKIVFSSARRPAKLMLNPDYDLQEKQYLRSTDKTEVQKQAR